jgi:hypothetical protein
MKPNYDEMSNSELRTYILANRQDIEAVEVFFARRSPDAQATWYAPPKTPEEWQRQMDVIHPIFETDRQKAHGKSAEQ